MKNPYSQFPSNKFAGRIAAQRNARNESIRNLAILIAAAVFFGIIASQMFSYSAKVDSDLAAISECVVKTANYQGYSGNPHSQEAWNLFAGECN